MSKFRRMLMMANAVPHTPVLPYDAEVEYLEGTGTQYIDTGIALYSNMEIGIVYQIVTFVSNSTIVGANAVSTAPRSGLYSLGMFTYKNTNYYSSNYNATTTSKADLGATSAFIEVVKKDNKTYVDGNAVIEVTSITTYSAGGNCYLFWSGGAHTDFSANKSKVKIKRFYVKDGNGNYLANYIPVRVGQVGYMYDKVSRQLFGNAGTGDFILGNDVNT